MTIHPPSSASEALLLIPGHAFHRLTEREFGMPGLVAIEPVGPFVEHVAIGPFLTIHDSTLAPGLGIGHHPHRVNERLFYILRGESGTMTRSTGSQASWERATSQGSPRGGGG